MSLKVYFDMDGTLADLYNSDNWEYKLRNEIPDAYRYLPFLPEIDMMKFQNYVQKLLEKGVQFGVISWLSMQSSPEYEEIVRQEKLDWIYENIPFVSEISIVSYGIPKQNAIIKRAQTMILIDDNVEVCKTWQTAKQRMSINVTRDWTVADALEEIYTRYCAE